MGNDPELDFSSHGLSKWSVDIERPKVIEARMPRSLSELFENDYSSLDDLRCLVENISYFRMNGFDFLYRGHSKSSFQLLSSSARCGAVDDDIEKCVLNDFRDKVYRECSQFRADSFNENLFYMGIGRHLGLNCRILDWTSGLWVALSFLANEDLDEDGELWVMAVPRDVSYENRSPFSIEDSKIHVLQEHFYYPGHNPGLSSHLALKRRSLQNGYFTVTAPNLLQIPINELSQESLDKMYLNKVSISATLKRQVRESNKYIDVEEWLLVKSLNAETKELISELNKSLIEKGQVNALLQREI